MDNLIGKTIGGRYRIIEQIGRGGMANVYKALDIDLERHVAIKVILPTNEFSDVFLRRFQREARTLAKLSHPNILTVFDYGEFDHLPYLVMEYISGGTLKDSLKGKPIPWQNTIQILIPVARALEAAHAQGIIHRDVKPSNILMVTGRNPKLSDFGIAKLIASNEETGPLTISNAGIGTPDYMAPEQGTGKSDERSDVYALGTVLYQMITGRLPYKGETPLELMLKKNTEPLPRPSQFVSNLPSAIENILTKALARDPNNRYGSMKEFAVTLESLRRNGRLGTVADTGEFFEATYTEDEDVRKIKKTKEEKGNWVLKLFVAVRRFFSQLSRESKRAEQPQLDAIRNWKESGTMTVNLIAALEPMRQKNILFLINREHELRIKDILVHFGGGRYLLHGFGRFGASALIDQIVEQTRSDIKKLHPENKQGIIMMVRVELTDLDDNDKVFKAIVRDFRFEAQREKYAKSIAKRLHRLQNNNFTRVQESGTENTISIKATPIPGLETSFSRKSDKTMVPVKDTTTESGIIDIISQFLDEAEDKKTNLFEKIVERVASSSKTPSRVIIVLDKIRSDKVFRVLQNMRLFSDDRITFFAIVREEEIVKWDSSIHQTVNDIGFREYYVPCVWEEEHHLAQDMVKLSLGNDHFLDEAALDFINHVAYKSRGAPGDMVKELVDPMYNMYETGVPQLRLDLLRDKKVVRFNSMLQNFLSSNWDKILADEFLGLRDTDRAKMGVYELMDWMTQQIEFNLSDLEQSLLLGKVSISPSAALRRDVVKRLIDCMIADELLSMNQDLYRVVIKKKIQENAQV